MRIGDRYGASNPFGQPLKVRALHEVLLPEELESPGVVKMLSDFLWIYPIGPCYQNHS